MKKRHQKQTKREAFRLEPEYVVILQLLAKVRTMGNKSQFLRHTLAEGLMALLPSFDDSWSAAELEHRINKAKRNLLLRNQPDYCELTDDLPIRAAQWLQTFHAAIAELADDPFSDASRKTYRVALKACPKELL